MNVVVKDTSGPVSIGGHVQTSVCCTSKLSACSINQVFRAWLQGLGLEVHYRKRNFLDTGCI